MRAMTRDEWRAFLMAGTRTGKLASTRADGRAHVKPIWFVLDGDDVVFTTWHETVAAANLRRDPRAALCVDDQTPPYSFVIVEGRVLVSEDVDELHRWATRIAGRYMGADRAQEFGDRNGVAGELLVRLAPDRVMTASGMAD